MTFSLKQFVVLGLRKIDLAYMSNKTHTPVFLLLSLLSLHFPKTKCHYFLSCPIISDQTEPNGAPEIPGTRFFSAVLTHVSFYTRPQLQDELLGFAPLLTKGFSEEHSRNVCSHQGNSLCLRKVLQVPDEVWKAKLMFGSSISV